ncbi:PQQ-binding-like beta-propeller repeat protein [Deinococcus sp. QL22]|uniref:outer membrane protein assembly factor BamB family protein n=1 Tax=Deinococcus sp. QL22 TaxID=2939437 RepID=UPI0020178908|nr:PQQ-binding-like beta-propeller repeat protein [Deinococcus sp. QL22]UQN10591.1 PQQ-like beta-propeller repeat protein [Deinococcus sp. QL22]
MYPPLVPISSEALVSGDTPVHFGDLIIAEENDSKYQKSLGEVAYDLNSRKVAWRTSEIFYGHESAVVGNHLIYFNGKHQIAVINPAGQEQSRTELPLSVPEQALGHLISTSVQVVGEVFILPMHSTLLAYRIDDLLSSELPAQPLWRFDVKALSSTGIARFPSLSCAVQEQACYVIESKGSPEQQQASTEVVKLDALTGQENWRKTLFATQAGDTPHLGVVQSGRGSIVVHVQGTSVVTAYTQSGTELWKNTSILCPGGATNILSHLIVRDDVVVVSPLGDRCYTALEASTGATRFVFSPPLGGSFGQVPSFVNGVMYATNGFLWAVDTEDGSILGRSTTELPYAQGKTGTVIFDAPRQQLLVWGGKLSAFRPVR